jgi:hypothetical protein
MMLAGPVAAPVPRFSFGPIRQRGTPPGVVAFDVLRRIYREFGLPSFGDPIRPRRRCR